MQNKPAATSVKIHSVIENRWSPRAFDPAKKIRTEDLTAVLEAARWAPSCYNDQPWRYIVWVRDEDGENWQKALSALAEKNQQWAKNAPVLLLASAMEVFGHNGKPNRWAPYDTGAASLNLCLQATALGLSVHQMAGFDVGKVRQFFGIPDHCQPMAMMALGYQAETLDSLGDDLKTTELAPRSRASLEERFYFGGWPA